MTGVGQALVEVFTHPLACFVAGQVLEVVRKPAKAKNEVGKRCCVV
jgi:hypothetical protein